jgi:hypothetical protein
MGVDPTSIPGLLERRRQDRPVAMPGMTWGVLLVAVLVGCVLWAAILVPLILWGPALWWDVQQAAGLIPPILFGPL